MNLTAVAGRVLIAGAALGAPIGAVRMDWNETHVYNPRWPPHAKFHNAQTIGLSVALAGATLWAMRPGTKDLRPAAALAATYWVTQAASMFFPGTALQDPEFPPPRRVWGVPIDQRLPLTASLIMAAAGGCLGRRLR